MRQAVLPFLCLSLAPPVLCACPIPVFRYALEFWEPDAYDVEILHRGPLRAEARAAADLLTECAEAEDASANLIVRFTDAERMAREGIGTGETPAPHEDVAHRAILQGHRPDAGATDHRPEPGAARLIVRLPDRHRRDAGATQRKPVWNVPATVDAVKKLIDSPARREIVRRLLDGESAVWVLLESGPRQADDAAAALLRQRLKRLAATLRLPEVLTSQVGGDALAQSEPELRLSFSMLRIAHDDAAEAFFVTTLTGSKPIPADVQEPIVVPVFGRGRALDALIGKDINAEKISAVGRFLVGPCSCRAKALNPGHDLLMTADWETELSGSLLAVVDLPPLAGLSALADAVGNAEANMTTQPTTSTTIAALAVPVEAAPAPGQDSSRLVRNTLIAAVLIVAVVALISLRIAIRPPKDQA
ncbi:MAG: hypothetical protein ACE5I3_09890 [Phycisphaerae bacterium]